MLRRALSQPPLSRRICLSASSRHFSPGLISVQRLYSTSRPPADNVTRPSESGPAQAPASSSSSTLASSLDTTSPSELQSPSTSADSPPATGGTSTSDTQASSEELLSRLRARAQEWSTQAAIKARLKTDDVLARLAVNLRMAGGEINRATGYNEIDALKKRVSEQGA